MIYTEDYLCKKKKEMAECIGISESTFRRELQKRNVDNIWPNKQLNQLNIDIARVMLEFDKNPNDEDTKGELHNLKNKKQIIINKWKVIINDIVKERENNK